ncbi:MAG: type IV toxin-antitoxin system AbiEi family antitoxin [Rhodothermaceae bacterium]
MENSKIEIVLTKLEKLTGIQFNLTDNSLNHNELIITLIYNGIKTKFTGIIRKTANFNFLNVFHTPNYNYPPLVIMDYINDNLAVSLEKDQINYLDAAGNAFIKTDSFFIQIKGNRPKSKPEKSIRLFQPSGLQLLFALLSNPGLERESYRTIASVAGVANGTVTWIMNDLETNKYLIVINKKRKIVKKDELFRKWAEQYALILRPKKSIGKFSSRKNDWQNSVNLESFGAVWGGEVAAGKISELTNPETFTIYVENNIKKINLLKTKAQLTENPNGNIQLVNKFWNFEDLSLNKNIVNPLLIYGDLISYRDSRILEILNNIYNRDIYEHFGFNK